MEILKKEMVSIIGNIPILSKLLIMFLFFELYFSLNNLSLWQLNFEFDKVNLAPFLYFLFFITFMLLPWLVINFIKDIVRIQIYKGAVNIVKWGNSYKSFLLLCLSIYFMIFPSYPEDGNLLIQKIYFIVLSIIAVSSFVYFFTSDIKYYNDKSDEVLKIKIVEKKANSLERGIKVEDTE